MTAPSQLAFDRARSSSPGDVSAEGNSGAAARADHLHGREAADANLTSTAGNISTIDVGDAASAGALTTGARADHQHALTSPASPTASAVGDAAGAGAATTVARADHRHGREAFATTADLADIAATESAGSAATVPRGDHVHALAGMSAWTAFTPTLTGATLSGGSSAYTIQGKVMTIRAFIITTASVTSFSFPLPGGATCPSLQVLAGNASGNFVGAQISAAGVVSVSCGSAQAGWVLTGAIEVS
jgi:hypothetical protein